MRKYLLAAIALVALTLGVLFWSVLSLFQNDLGRQRTAAVERMRGVAQLAGSLAADRHNSRNDTELDTLLVRICEGAGCARVVITDELGLVRWSGHPLISRGDDITPFLVDKELFDRSLRDTSIHFTKTMRIGGSWFQSIYYPYFAHRKMFLVIVEADREYLTSAERFRANITRIGIAAGLLLAFLIGSITMIARRAALAAAHARENEHLAFLGRASAELTHELKNPLAIIKSSVDVLRRKYDPDDTVKPFAFVSEEIMRLSRLINSILSFSREKHLRTEPFFPSPILADALSRVEHRQSIAYSVQVPERIQIIGDRDAFVQIADNLIRNAIGAAHGEPISLKVCFEQSGGEAHFHFDDSGRGIPESIRKTVFSPFVSGHQNGTGLGLSIVKTLCSRMRWRIDLDHSGPRGTRFTLHIPEELWHEFS